MTNVFKLKDFRLIISESNTENFCLFRYELPEGDKERHEITREGSADKRKSYGSYLSVSRSIAAF